MITSKNEITDECHWKNWFMEDYKWTGDEWMKKHYTWMLMNFKKCEIIEK